MKVLILSQYFPPEVGATQTRVEVFARHLSFSGHEVTVIAEVPNHPVGVVFDGFRRRAVHRRSEGGYEVVRVWVAASPKKSFWRRILFYATYALNAVLAGLLVVRRRPDVVLATSPPLPVALAGLILASVWRRPLVLDIRDIWPAVAVALGELDGDRTIEAAERVERFLYQRAAAMTTVSNSFVAHIVATGTNPEKVHLVPNGTLPDLFNPEHVEPNQRQRLGLKDGFVVGYVGLHGIAQGLNALVDAAAKLAAEGVQLLMVGEGPVKAELERHARDLGVENVIFCDGVPLEEVAALINACDAMIVPLRRLAILNGLIPSKVFDYMACAKPVILMVDGEARSLIEQADAGVYVEAENADLLAEAIRQLASEPAEAKRMGPNGRSFVLGHYVRSEQARRLEQVLTTAAGEGSRRKQDS